MLGQETDHLTRNLQVRHPTVEIDPVKTLQIQTDMPIKDVVHSHDTGGHGAPPQQRQPNPATLPSPNRHVTYQPNHHLGGPRRSLLSSTDQRPTRLEPHATACPGSGLGRRSRMYSESRGVPGATMCPTSATCSLTALSQVMPSLEPQYFGDRVLR